MRRDRRLLSVREHHGWRALRELDMATGRAMYDITRWSFTHVEDRRRYTDHDMPGAADREDYTGTEIAMCPGYSARNWQNDASAGIG